MEGIFVKATCLILTAGLLGCGDTASDTASRRSTTVGVAKLLGERRYEEAYAVSSDLLDDGRCDEVLMQLHDEACERLSLSDNSESSAHSPPKPSNPQNEFTVEFVARAAPFEPDPAYGKKAISSAAKPTNEPTPAEVVYRKYLEGVAHLHQDQMEADARALLEKNYDRHSGWDELPMDQEPKRIVRADLGLGMLVEDISIPRIPATGRSTPWELLEQRPRNRMLAVRPIGGFASPMPYMPILGSRLIAPPARNELLTRSPFECSDSRDNDGDGLSDRGDSDCWLDPLLPRTYMPYRTEGDPPSARADLPSSLVQPAN